MDVWVYGWVLCISGYWLLIAVCVLVRCAMCVHDFLRPLRDQNMHKILPQSLGNGQAYFSRYLVGYALLKMATAPEQC